MDRRRLLMDGGGGSSGTSRIEYLESDGNQYIDTGKIMKSNSSFVYSFAITDLSKLAGVMGARKSTSSGHMCNVFTQNNKLRLDLRQNTTTYASIDQGVRYDLHYRYYNSVQFIRISSHASYGWNYDFNTSMFLFTFSDTNGSATGYGGAPQRVYGYKMYTGEDLKLVMDLIPYKYDGEGCMYDRVSGEYFFNLGTGSFTCGPEVSEDYVGMMKFFIWRDGKTLTYTVPEDMTWADFIDSGYNDLGLYANTGSSSKIIFDSSNYMLQDWDYSYIYPNDPIGRNIEYFLS